MERGRAAGDRGQQRVAHGGRVDQRAAVDRLVDAEHDERVGRRDRDEPEPHERLRARRAQQLLRRCAAHGPLPAQPADGDVRPRHPGERHAVPERVDHLARLDREQHGHGQQQRRHQLEERPAVERGRDRVGGGEQPQRGRRRRERRERGERGGGRGERERDHRLRAQPARPRERRGAGRLAGARAAAQPADGDVADGQRGERGAVPLAIDELAALQRQQRGRRQQQRGHVLEGDAAEEPRGERVDGGQRAVGDGGGARGGERILQRCVRDRDHLQRGDGGEGEADHGLRPEPARPARDRRVGCVVGLARARAAAQPAEHDEPALGVLPRKVVHRREAGTAPPTPPCGRR